MIADFLANIPQRAPQAMEWAQGFWARGYQYLMTTAFSLLLIWLVIRILKSDDTPKGPNGPKE